MYRRSFLRTGAAVGAGLAAGSAAVPAATADDGDYAPLGRVPVPGAAEAVVGDDGETVYLAAVDGVAAVDVNDPEEPTVVAEDRDLLGDEHPPMRDVLDVTVDGDRLVAAGPANPDDPGETFHGVAIYDVSDPGDLVAAGEPYETDFHIHNCHLDGDLLYLTGNDGEENPLVIVDVGGDDPEEVGRWSLLDADPDWSDVDWILRYVHDVTVRDDVAVLAYWDAGTCLLDVSDPGEPEPISRVSDVDAADVRGLERSAVADAQQTLPGNDHYSALDDAGEVLAIGREAWSLEADDADGVGGIDLFDASDPADPAHLATIEAPETPDATYRGGAWTTAHNFEFRGDRLLSSWYRGGVAIHDVSDPADPSELARWRDPDEAAFWTARAASDDVFVASSTSLLPNAPTEGALYTFPLEAGEQADPPSFGDVGGGNETDGETNETNATNETDEDGGDGGASATPGFTAVGAVAGGALVAAAAAARRRSREE